MTCSHKYTRVLSRIGRKSQNLRNIFPLFGSRIIGETGDAIYAKQLRDLKFGSFCSHARDKGSGLRAAVALALLLVV